MTDHYVELGVSRKATQQQVYDQYCRMAVRWHPDKPENRSRSESNARFTSVAHAYAVLIHPEHRQQFDQTGSFSLSEYSGTTGFHQAQTLYKQVFGGVGLNEDGRAPTKEACIVRELLVSLEDLYGGATKKIKVTRNVLDPKDHMKVVQASQVVEVVIKPGWKSGTKVTFERLGDERPGAVASDLVFVIGEKPHSRFRRKNNDLEVRVQVRLKEALLGGETRMKTLDGRTLVVPFEGPLQGLEHQVLVPDEGMPLPKKPDQRGQLCVILQVVMPVELSPQARLQLSDIVF